MRTSIIVRLQVEGLHQWKGCDIEDVMFLAEPHRHIFHIECRKKVSHNDRDIEIICFKRSIQRYLAETYAKGGIVCNFGGMSCEMIAMELTKKFNLTYCSVLEDNENGAEVVSE